MQQGYWKADATVEREEGDGRLTIVFTVRKGAQYRIADGVDIHGNRSVPIEQLRPALVKLQANDIFVESNLAAAVSAIAGQYQRLGYAQAKVNAAANERNPPAPGQGLVQPVITIVEGPLTVVGAVRFEGARSIPEEQLRPLVTSTPGTPYYEPRIAADRDKVVLDTATVASSRRTSWLCRRCRPTDAARIDVQDQRRAADDHRPHPDRRKHAHRSAGDQARAAAAGGQAPRPGGCRRKPAAARARSGCSAVSASRSLPHGGAATKDVLVTVEEAAATTFGYGGGAEVTRRLLAGAGGAAQERLDLAPRGFIDLGLRNIGGKNRSVDIYSRLALHPESSATGTTGLAGFGFAEYRVVGTYREPRAIGVNADLAFTAAIEQGIGRTFNFARKGVNAEVARRLAPGRPHQRPVLVRHHPHLRERTADAREPGADRSRVSAGPALRPLPGAISRDTRDDVLDPERGNFLSAESSVAARALGGQVGFFKSVRPGLLVPPSASEQAGDLCRPHRAGSRPRVSSRRRERRWQPD